MSYTKKLLAGTALGALLAVGISGGASAAPFTVNEGVVPGATANTLVANGITFSYSAIINQAANGSFTETGFLNKASFVDANSASVPSQLNSLAPAGYAIYGLFTATGVAVANPPFPGGVTATFNTFALTLTLDPNQDTTQSANGTAGGFTVDDRVLANYTLNVGQAHVFGGLANGDFDVLMNITLTSFGQTFFTSPTPFFPLEDLSGNTALITGLSLPGTAFTATANGAGVELFVPEPASIAVLGAGLVALGGVVRRRRKN